MRLRSHTLSPQHFAKVISYPTRQTPGSQWAEHSSYLVQGGKKGGGRIKYSSFLRATGWVSSFVLQKKKKRINEGKVRERKKARILCFRSHQNAGFLSHPIPFTQRLQCRGEMQRWENHLEFVKRCSRVKALKQQLSPRLSTRCSPPPLAHPFPPALIMHVDFKI